MKNQMSLKVPTSILVTILLIAPLSLLAGPAGAATTITKLGTGNSEEYLTFTGAGEDTSLYLNIPRGCAITSASISLEGQFIKSPTPTKMDFDYNDTDDKSGWRGTTSENISSTQKTPQGFGGSQFGAGDMSSLTDDDGRYISDEMKAIAFAFHQFKYDVSMTDITEIQVEWNGWAMYIDGTTWENLYGAQMFIWNNATQQWELLAYYDNWKDSSDYWLQKTITGSNLDNYLYNNIELRIIVQNYYSDKSNVYAAIYSDFAKVVVTGKRVEFPSEVKLDISDDGTVELTQPGLLTTTITYSGAGFKSILQSIVNFEGPGAGDIKVPISVSSDTPGKVRVGNVSIVYDPYVNQAPQASEIPDTFHFAEDTDAANLINLSNYFSDDLDKSWDLTYSIDNESDPEFIHATVSAHGLMSFTTPTENWFGSATFKVTATDSSSLSVTSAAFSVTVDPKPDAPVLKPIPVLNFTEGKPAAVAISANDPDNLFGGTDTLSYSSLFTSGKTLFTINSASGTATFLPKDADVGTYTVTFTVADAIGNTDTEDVSFKVNDVNNAPTLDPVSKQVMNEDALFTLQLSATDPDASDADALEYSVDFPDGMTLFTMGTDGAVSFTPNQTMVGTHKVRFSVTDSGGLKDTKEATFEIKNVNDAPTIKAIADKTVNRNTPFSLQVEASDEDIGYAENELLTFADNTNMFTIDEITGWINFTPTKAQAGKYTVTITVTDLAGATATTSFKLEVVLNNTAPAAKVLVSGNKTKIKEGGKFVLTADASDADNDQLTYKWTEKGKELGTTKELTLKGLSAGKHTVTLEVSDGITKTSVEQALSVEKTPKGLPGFDASVALMAMFLVALVSLFVGRRRL